MTIDNPEIVVIFEASPSIVVDFSGPPQSVIDVECSGQNPIEFNEYSLPQIDVEFSEFAYPGVYYLKKKARTDLSGHRIVCPGSDGMVGYADYRNGIQSNSPLWMTMHATMEGETVKVISLGEITESSWNWDLGKLIFLGENGGLTQEAPLSNGWLILLGTVVSIKTLFYDAERPLKLEEI